MTPQEYCQNKAAASGSSFYYSFFFLPPLQRAAITALYAFCREVDDVVDDARDFGVAAMKLAWWRSEVGDLYKGTPQHPVTLALAPAIAAFNLPQEEMEEVIDGMEMDLRISRYSNFKELSLYCHRVAGVVGLMAAEIFGVTKRETRKYASDLGTAFQLTNIIRDVGEDARRGRIYLPQDELQRFGVTAADLLEGRYSENFTALMKFQIERAEGYYEQALAVLPSEDRKTQRAGLIMAEIYRALLQEVRDRKCKVLHQRISLSPRRKFWIAGRTWAVN